MTKRKSHQHRSFRRRRPFREPRECVLIVCEGSKTEPGYFKSLCRELGLSNVEVEVVGEECGSAPISVVDEALDREKERRLSAKQDGLPVYDVIWCVVDVEAPVQHKSLSSAIDKAKSNNLNMVLSNPCFEFWYLLHFQRTSRLLSNDDVIVHLKKHIKDYKKNSDVFAKLYPATSTAISNAEGVLKEKGWQDERNLKDCNPSTHVHQLVARLRKTASTNPSVAS